MAKTEPKIVIHGGLGLFEGVNDTREVIHKSLSTIIERAYEVLIEKGARAAVIEAVRLLEDDSLFNAGTGSRFQADGKIRMSASFMTGSPLSFSGVINVRDIQHPINMAENLQNERYSVLAGDGVDLASDEWGLPYYNPETTHRREEFEANKVGKSGTVGAVALDKNGKIVVGTSTGGTGNETPGRVGDTPTVAGNYASENAGVSVTGVGEEIVNLAVASRIVTLVDEGISIKDAAQSVMTRAIENQYNFGIISLDRYGNCIVDKTSDEIYYALHDGQISTFYGS